MFETTANVTSDVAVTTLLTERLTDDAVVA